MRLLWGFWVYLYLLKNKIQLLSNDIIRTVLIIVKITVMNIMFTAISCIQNHYSRNELKLKYFDISISLIMAYFPLWVIVIIRWYVFNYGCFRDSPLKYLNID